MGKKISNTSSHLKKHIMLHNWRHRAISQRCVPHGTVNAAYRHSVAFASVMFCLLGSGCCRCLFVCMCFSGEGGGLIHVNYQLPVLFLLTQEDFTFLRLPLSTDLFDMSFTLRQCHVRLNISNVKVVFCRKLY